MRLESQPVATARTLLLVGGGGGVGSIAIQIAKRVAGLHVIATAGHPMSVDFCSQMGTDAVIDHSQDLAPQIRALGLDGVSYILNCAVMANFQQLVAIRNPLGIICCVVGREGTKALDVSGLFPKRGTLAFEYMFTRSRFDVEPERQGMILNRVGVTGSEGTL